jgi:hypothetical protein
MIKIVPYNYGLDEEMRENPTVNLVGIEEISVTYVQEPDTNSRSDEYQHLTVTTKTVCGVSKEDSEKKEGFYFDITIPGGEHWSINDGDELKAIIEDFKRRIYLKK